MFCFLFNLVVYFHLYYARCPHHCCPSCRRHRHHHYHVLCCHQDIPYLLKKYEINVFYLSITVYIPRGLGTVWDVGTCFSVRVRLRGVRTCFGYGYGAGTVWVRYVGMLRSCVVPERKSAPMHRTSFHKMWHYFQHVMLVAGTYSTYSSRRANNAAQQFFAKRRPI